jgi:hypothetical protein
VKKTHKHSRFVPFFLPFFPSFLTLTFQKAAAGGVDGRGAVKKTEHACDRDATLLRSQLEPYGTPHLRNRLFEHFGVATDQVRSITLQCFCQLRTFVIKHSHIYWLLEHFGVATDQVLALHFLSRCLITLAFVNRYFSCLCYQTLTMYPFFTSYLPYLTLPGR